MRTVILFLPICLILTDIVQRIVALDSAAIGVIYHPDDEALAQMLKDRVRYINKTLSHDTSYPSNMPSIEVIPIRTTSSKKLLSYDNLLKMSCAIAIFDLSFADHPSFAFAEVLTIPLLSFKPVLQDLSNEFVYSALPSYETYARAIVDLLVYTVGENPREEVAILFEDEYSRVATKVYSIAREMEKFQVDAIPELEMNSKEQFQLAMDVLVKVGASYVLVICRPENLATILDRAIQLGAIKEQSKWFALDMDLGGNISRKCFNGLVGLQVNLAHPDKAKRLKKNDRKKTSEINYALVNDTLYAVVEAFKQDVEKIRKTSSCFQSGKSSVSSGTAMLSNLNNVKMTGISGLVSFDNRTRSRVVESLDIVNVQEWEDENENTQSVLTNVGHWVANKEKTARSKPVLLKSLQPIDWIGTFWKELQCLVRRDPNNKGRYPLKGRLIKVVTIEDSPFCQKRDNQTEPTERGHGYEGFSIDLLEKVKDALGFEYELIISKKGKMNDLIDDLKEKKAHVAIGAITITAGRERMVDFSKPFMDFKISLLMQKPEGEELNLFAFLQPFQMDVWLSTIAVVIGITLLIYCLDYFSPSGYRATAASTGEGDGDELNLFNSLWFAAGSILQQGADNTPRCASGRMLGGAFWFFTLILISTYTANLAAYFTAKNAKSNINSLDDLANQNEIEYGVLKGGSLATFFEKSEVSIYSKMYQTMKRENNFVNSTKEGVARVRKGRFAYLTDEPYLDYYDKKSPCNTMMLKNLLEAKSYGIGLQRNSDLTNQFSVAILKLREEGVVADLRKKWWDHRSDCRDPQKPAPTTAMSISLDHMAGVFIVLAAGIVVSVVFLLIERRCSNLKEQVKAGSMTSVRDQMDQPTVQSLQGFSRPLSVETKTINNIDNRRNLDAKDGARASDNLSVPRRQGRLPNIYAGAPESNL